MFHKRYVNYLIIIILGLFLNGCLNNKRSKIEINNTKPIVLTTFTVIADMARNVAGDRLEVISITKPGSEIHGYNPTPSDLIKATNASLFIENGLGLELWADKYTADIDLPRVVLSQGIKPILISEDAYKGKPNPHVWMSPKKAIHYVNNLVYAFSELDPNGRNIFKKNGEIYKKRLIALDKELQLSLSSIPSSRRILITCEGAFSYLTSDYGLKEAYLWPVNADSNITPKRMVKLIELIKVNNVPTIFCESTVNSKAQIEIAKETGSKFGGKFFVDSLSEKGGPAPTYIKLLEHNLNLIKKGLK
tara:strand:- start:2369 stop:3283 length:915 start_codon:yes stop_codon:yes gene_type:complete